MTKQIHIAGAGGGKSPSTSSARTPVELPDSLRSQATARILDLLCEGEIEGLANGLQSVYLNETPLQNADGSFNFTGVTVSLNTGTQQQSYITGFTDSESETAVNTVIKAAIPLTRQLLDDNLDAVRVTVSVAALYKQNTTTGDMYGASVDLAIDVQSAGGTWQQVKTDTITGKTMNRYQRAYRIPLTGSSPWQVRVRRLTPDSTTATVQDQLSWDSYTEIIDAKLRFPNSAVAGIVALSSQFASIPSRAYDVKMLRLRVPSNYDPISRVYTGAWDGTFKTAWSDNPAWGFHRVVTHPRYGLGNLIPEQYLDKWLLYQIGQYCDELVPDGFGGMEPRFTMNVYLQSRADAFKVVNDLASVFRGMAYYAAGQISAAQDAPADPVALYCPANVVDGRLVYQGSAKRARHTVALVAWNDPDNMYRQAVEYVDDPEGVKRYGINSTQITAIGCASRGQAHRAGKWLLYSERMETETVTFRVGLDGTYLRPGNVIKLIDPDRDGQRLSGRIHAATAIQVALDAGVTIESGKTYDLYCMLPSGILEHRRVDSAAGEFSVLTLLTPFSAAPQEQAIWALAPSDLEAALYRVLAVTEPEAGQLEITALVHHPEKYDEIEQGVKFDQSGNPNLPSAGLVEPPSNLTITEELYPAVMGAAGVRLLISWDRSPNRYVQSYTCEIRPENGNWLPLSVEGQTAQYEGATQGVYQIRVIATSVLGVNSVPAEITYTVIAMTAPPADVTGLQIYGRGNVTEYDGRECRLTWNKVTTIDAGGPADGEAGAQPPEGWFKDYVLKVYSADGSLRRTEFPSIETWNYSYERNYQDGTGTPARNFRVEITARDRWFRESAHPSTISVSNPPPRALTAGEISINAFAGAFTVDLTPVSIPDIAGYLIYASQQAGFTPTETELISRGSTHVYRKADPGTWYIRVAAYDTFGQDALIFSEEYSCVVIDSLVLPDQLYTTLRTDFWVRDSIFFFNETTLEWSTGSITRGTENFTLEGGNLELADSKYIIATLGGGVAVLRMEPIENGVPSNLLSNEVIIAVTSSLPNSAGNFLCFVRQANSIQLEGALIRNATITDAHITGTLSADKISSLNGTVTVTIGESGVTLADIQTTADQSATAAAAAQTAANTAGSAASSAQTAANTANRLLSDISNDDKLTPEEKSATLKEWSSILAEKAAIDAQADTFTVSRSAYDGYYDALNSYITPLLSDPASTSDIVGTDFRARFHDYYLGRTNLLNAIAAKARSLALTAQTTAESAATTANWGSVSGIPLRFADPAPAGTGLFIGTDHMGYYSSGWKSYLKNDGSFYFSGKDTNSFIRWDGGAADLLVRGKLTADDIQSGGTISGCKLQTADPVTGVKSFVVDDTSHQAYFYTAGTEVLSLGKNALPSTTDLQEFLGLEFVLAMNMGYDPADLSSRYVIPPDSDPYWTTPVSTAAGIAYQGTGPGIVVHSSSPYLASFAQMGANVTGGSASTVFSVSTKGRSPGYFIQNADSPYGTDANIIMGLYSFSLDGCGVVSRAYSGVKKAFYSMAGGYGPFTGVHDVLLPKGFAAVPGDILVDSSIFAKASVSDCLSVAILPTAPLDPAVIGVFVGKAPLNVSEVAALAQYNGEVDLSATYDLGSANAIGEGQVNVCKEGGDIKAGDLICSSSTPGKGMRQPDDIMRSYTVAKARESCSWEADDASIKQISCTYHCG